MSIVDITSPLFWYLAPMIICLIMCWIEQIIKPKSEYDYFFGAVAFFPVANIFGALISLIIIAGWLGITIVSLPTLVKEYLNHDTK